ncbi:MAG: cation:proton antiporter [Magnetospirillum sp. WYHS-4]
MSGVAVAVMGVAGLLAAAVVAEPLARRVRLPLSLVLTLAGAAIGLALEGESHGLRASLTLSSEAFLYLFLPILLFETAIEIDVRRLLDDVGPILLLAVVAVLASTLVVGFSLAAMSSYGLVACLLLAAIVSTTDPVAVVALFRDLSVPHRLTLLVEGESLFNDAAAIALFSVLLAMLAGGEGGWDAGLRSFLRGFSGGIVVGFLLAQAASRFLPYLPGKRMAEVTVTVAVAYLAFVIGEYGLHVSGVVAVVVAALVFAYDGRTRVSPESWSFLVGTWKQLGYWASSLVFLLAALRIPGLLAGTGPSDALMLAVLTLGALAARGLVLFGLMPILSGLGLAQRVGGRLRLVILWGGLRGAISLALALAVVEHPAVPPEVKRLVATLATAFVLVTLFVNGLTLRPLIRALKLDRLAPVDRFLRGRAIAHGLGTVNDRIAEAATEYRIDATARDRLADDYTRRLEEAEQTLEAHGALSEDERLRAALVTAARREQVLYFRHYRERIVSGRIVRNLVAGAYHLEDRAKAEGRAGYEAAACQGLAFPLPFRLAMTMHRRFGWDGLLASGLADRLEALLVARATANELLQFADRRIPAMLGAQAALALGEVLTVRLNAIEGGLSALRLQYGDFVEKMQIRYLERAALRIEDAEYQRLFNEAVIGKEVFDDLRRDLAGRWRNAEGRPPLDLSMEPKALLARVPLFNGLEAAALESIARLLKPRFAVPGEPIIRKGEKGREMFFLVSGAVDVAVSDQPVRLGSGDFFGELALLTQAPRTADVTALGYCELLVLTATDFSDLLGHHPDLSDHIAATAKVRAARR